MIIDGFTVAAQALNFVLLVALLRYFLYQPVLSAIDAREARIAEQLASAAATRAEAEERYAALDAKHVAFEDQRAARLAETEEAAGATRERLLTAAKADADAAHDRRRRAFAAEMRSLNHTVSRQTIDEVFAIVRRTLHDLADTSLEDRITAVLVDRIGALDGDASALLAQAFDREAPVARSAFALTAAQQAQIQAALRARVSSGVVVRFETDPALIGGVEVTAHGQRVGMSLDAYLGDLQESVDELLVEREDPLET